LQVIPYFGGPDARRGDLLMPNPPDPTPHPGQPGVVSDPDVPHSFGPDAPNVRDDDPPPDLKPPIAAPPTPPAEPLEEDEIAPDEF
jgi:hypothetical protein